MNSTGTASRWQSGHVSTHDLAAAGRASRKVGHWERPFPRKAMLVRRLELIKRAARKESRT